MLSGNRVAHLGTIDASANDGGAAGTGEAPRSPVYIDGEHSTTLKGDGVVDEFKEILLDYVKRTYAPRVAAGAASEE